MHPTTASEYITVLLYNGPLLGGFTVAITGLKQLGLYDTDRAEQSVGGAASGRGGPAELRGRKTSPGSGTEGDGRQTGTGGACSA